MCLLIFFFLHYVWHTWIPSSNRQRVIFLGTWKSSTGPQQNKKTFPIMLCTAELKWWGKERESIMKKNEKLCSEFMDILFIFVTRSLFPPLGCKATQIYITVTWREHLFPEKQLYCDENWVSQESTTTRCVFKLLRHKLDR